MLIEEGIEVSADFSYFYQKSYINQGYTDSGISVFPWQLDAFGINRSAFNISTSSSKSLRICDGNLKIALFLKAVSSKSPIRKKFLEHLGSYSQQINRDSLLNEKYACVHIRRGDYVAVASHLIPLESYISILKSISSEDLNLCVLSDSLLCQHERRSFSQLGFKRVAFLTESCPPEEAFSIMVASTILITSNSQFSLSAGLLSQGSMYIPTQWYKKLSRPRNDRQQTELIESTILRCCRFALWDGVPLELIESSALDLMKRCQ